jgi:hypothetical protein
MFGYMSGSDLIRASTSCIEAPRATNRQSCLREDDRCNHENLTKRAQSMALVDLKHWSFGHAE